MGCHGLNAVSGLLISDLRGSAYIHDPTGWDSVVRDGALRARGMASFASELDREESASIRAFIIDEAQKAKARQASR